MKSFCKSSFTCKLGLLSVIFVSLITSALPLQADTVADAYAKEFTYLKAQKSELQQRIANEKSNQARNEREARQQLVSLRSRYLELTSQVNEKQIALNRLREDLEALKGGENVIDSVLLQMESTLTNNGFEVVAEAPVEERVSSGFTQAGQLINQLSTIRRSDGVYYTTSGDRTDGTIVEVGNIALLGAGNNDAASGALVPAGGGKFRLWEQPGSAQDAVQLAEGALPEQLSLYLLENKETEVVPPRQKTPRSVIESGGVIGYIILGLGAVGLLFSVFRFFTLSLFGSAPADQLARTALTRLGEGDRDGAWKKLKKARGSVPSVLRDVIQHIERKRESLDDVITESVLRESIKLDRFGPLILVIASVAPLLGLLGTVTGMIATFDLITEFGTGDPKLLADGISVALVTTMLGLAVAIPLLLIGNLLSGWARRIKDRMERTALLAVTQFETSHARH